mmetsp:Transcript_37023/g.82299  ORF Transcript_37023/g.82299 Transcript_37023/m.82299 type:complete len:474 (+) Transcript_37023:167-1588(+)
MACTGSFCTLLEGLTSPYLWNVLLAVLPIWLFGAVTGYLLPRPKWASEKPLSWTTFFVNTSGLRKFFLAWHGFLILREVWYKITDPGTFRRFCKAVVLWVCGQGWHFDFPSADQPGVPAGFANNTVADKDNWYVTEKDLAFFQYHGEGSGALQGAGPWELLMEKDITNTLKYTSWRRVLPNGKTEYKSITICPDASAEEFIDLYFDDDNRPNWDNMIIQKEVLEHGDFSQRQQVVRWMRRFPFSFISDREYVIARRFFRQGDSLYGITKAVDHPRASREGPVVRVDVYYSMWRSRAVACPWGSGKPAVETTLLHHEQLKIPENLARFAVKHGMWGFVRKMASNVEEFVRKRRARGVAPTAADPLAYGAGYAPNPPMTASQSTSSLTSMGSLSSSITDASSDAGTEGNSGLPRNNKKLKGLAAFVLASTVAMIVHRNAPTGGSETRSRLSTKGPARRYRGRFSDSGRFSDPTSN